MCIADAAVKLFLVKTKMKTIANIVAMLCIGVIRKMIDEWNDYRITNNDPIDEKPVLVELLDIFGNSNFEVMQFHHRKSVFVKNNANYQKYKNGINTVVQMVVRWKYID